MTNDAEGVKDAAYEGFARLALALAHPYRLRTLELLAQGERCVQEVEAHTPLGRKNASAQLRVLLEAGLVKRRREGRRSYYRIADPRVIPLLRALQADARERDAGIAGLVTGFYEADPSLAPLGIEGLHARLEKGNVVLLDVRPAEEFAKGHLPGATSLPLSELAARLDELPRDREILVYCRGPYCVWEVDAVRLLRASGYDAVRTGVGKADWSISGRPLSRAAA